MTEEIGPGDMVCYPLGLSYNDEGHVFTRFVRLVGIVLEKYIVNDKVFYKVDFRGMRIRIPESHLYKYNQDG